MFFFIILLLVVLSVLGSVSWYLFWFFIIKAAVDQYAKNFEAEQHQLCALIEQSRQHQIQQQYSQRTFKTEIAPEINAQALGHFLNMQNQLRQMNDLHRQRYEVSMGNMLSSAAEAGISIDTNAFRY